MFLGRIQYTVVVCKVFIVEDNELIREAVQEYFEVSGYQTHAFGTLKETRAALQYLKPDVVLLDVMLPDGNGFVFAREIRQQDNVPILFLTAKDDESDRILGFEVGGDDYVVKPFSNKELLLRVKALLRRSAPYDTDPGKDHSCLKMTLDQHALCIDETARKVYLDFQEVHLTSSEWNILSYLARHPEQAVSREAILGECLGYLHGGSERIVDTHIAKLRSILDSNDWIETVWGYGYRFAGKPDTTHS